MSQTNNKTHKLYKLTVWQRYSGIYSQYFASEDEARNHVNSDYSEELPENKYPGDRSHTEITEFVFTRSIYFVKSEN